MEMLAQLDQAIKAVCPIDGISLGETVRIDFRDEATAEQRAAAQAVVDAWDWNAPEPVELYPYELLGLLRPEQIVAMQLSVEPYVVILRSKLQTIVSKMPMQGAEMQQALQVLVAFGIITEIESQKLTQGESLQ